MKSMMAEVIEDILLYNNKSMLIVLFVLALVFLWLTEKDRGIRTILVYLSVALVVIFLCPLYIWVGMKIDNEIYYRVLWTMPIGILVCYSVVKAIIHFKSVIGKILVGVIAVLVICINGKLVYTNSIYFKATNSFHIPASVINVAEALKLDNYKPIAVMPKELLPFLRQYSCDIFTPYGREMTEPNWSVWRPHNDLYDAMEADVYNIQRLVPCALEENCVYVVLSCAKQQVGNMEDYDFFLKNFVDGYYIYMYRPSYEVLKEQGLLSADELID